MKTRKIPKIIKRTITELEKAGFEAFIVGGCVRDLLLERVPNDWDIATNATPREIIGVFPDGKYENDFGTVLVSDKYLTGLEVISEEIDIKPEEKEVLIEVAKERYLNKIECRGHGLLHAKKVVKNALEIAKTFKRVRPEFIELIAFFHDTGRAVVDSEGHIERGQEITEKEAQQILSEEAVMALKAAVLYNSGLPRKSLEAQILIESDLIEGVNIERIKNIKKRELKKEHEKWLKDYFNEKGAFKEIFSKKGRELMFQAIESFNEAKIGFDLPQISLIQNENIEITTYRIESTYTDRRHPDQVKFAKTLKEDLSRRDFTINAMAMGASEESLVDLFEGSVDLKRRAIRAVGDPSERFNEDALRMLRAVRFAVQLNFEIEKETLKAIKSCLKNINFISIERIRDEFEKTILSDNPARGIELFVDTGLMQYIIPEIMETVGVMQNHHHYRGPYNTVYKHLVASLKKCPSDKLEVRLAAFLHDIGKPGVKQGEGEFATFYNHEYAGARIAQRILKRLKFPRKIIEKTVLLVKNHMFYYNVDEVGEAGVRRVVKKVGVENIQDLIDVRVGDRLGSGVPKAIPYKLRHFQFMVEKVSKDPISVKQLKINGNDLIEELKVDPGAKIGAILEILLAKVIKDPKLNTREFLLKEANELKKQDLDKLRKGAKAAISEKNKEEEEKTKQKHWVK